MVRWEIFREKKERFIEYFIEVKNRKVRSQQLITFIVLQKMLRYLADYFNG